MAYGGRSLRLQQKRTRETIGHYKPVYVLEPPADEKEALPYSLDVLRRTYDVLPSNGELMDEPQIQAMPTTVRCRLSTRMSTAAAVRCGRQVSKLRPMR